MKIAKKLFNLGNIKFDEPNFSDRFLDKTFLWIFPKFVTPNHITLFRYLIIPSVFYLLLFSHYKWGLLFFTIAAFSDALDGAMARTRNKTTNWGKIHDPLADKILIGVSGAVLVTRFINFRIMLVIALIEFLTVISVLRVHDKKGEMGARLPGKIKMILQSGGLVLLLIYGVFFTSWALGAATALLYGSIFFGTLNVLLYRAL